MGTMSAEEVRFVAQCLQRGVSDQESERDAAASELDAMEVQPGFLVCLLHIVVGREEMDADTRLLAAVQCKRVVDRRWRRPSKISDQLPYMVSNDERQQTRPLLLSEELLQEPVREVAIQIAIVIASIARTDYPTFWPNAISDLMDRIGACDSALMCARISLVLRHTVEQLSARRLQDDRATFYELCQRWFSDVSQLWSNQFDRLVEALARGGDDTLEATVDVVKSAFKACRAMLLCGFERHDQEQAVIHFLERVYENVEKLVGIWTGLDEDHPACGCIEKQLRLMLGLVVALQEKHPLSFTPLLVPFLSLCYRNVTLLAPELCLSPDRVRCCSGSALSFRVAERVVVQALKFLKNVIYCVEYRGDLVSHHDEMVESAIHAFHSFFSEQRIVELGMGIIKQYLVYSFEDLEQWSDDPEGFLETEENLAPDYSARGAAEAVFIVSMHRFGSLLAPHVCNLLQESMKLGADLEQCVLRDACYHATGLAVDQVTGTFDFGGWWRTALEQELALSGDTVEGRVIRRRVCWFISQCVMELDDEKRVSAYELATNSMNTDDMVMRFACLRALQNLVDDVSFDAAGFLPFFECSVAALFSTLEHLSSNELRMELLPMINVFVMQLSQYMGEYVEKILECYANFWSSCAEDELMKNAIVRGLQVLVREARDKLLDYVSFLVPVLDYCTRVGTPEALYLMEDGLMLWSSILKAVPISASCEVLFPLCPRILDIVSFSMEHFLQCLKIIESYILCGQDDFISEYSSTVVGVFDALVGNLRDEGMFMVFQVLHTYIMMHRSAAIRSMPDVLVKIAQYMGEKPRTCAAVQHEYMALLGRVILIDMDFFGELNSHERFGGKLLPQYIVLCEQLIDAFSDMRTRKLVALSLCSLLGIESEAVLHNVALIVNVIGSVTLDVHIHEDRFDYAYFLIDIVGGEDEDTESTLAGHTRARLFHADPVTTMCLRDCALARIEHVCESSPQYRDAIARHVDERVLDQMRNPPSPPPVYQ